MRSFKGSIPIVGSYEKVPALKFDNGHWAFEEQMGKGVGFIYVIKDKYLNRLYLGKKTYYSAGKLTKGKESDWRRYKSSSKSLGEMFKERPREEFEFITIEQYTTKGTLSYSETWSLCLVEAPTSKDWYNTLVEKVSWPVKEAITERHKNRLAAVCRGESFDKDKYK